MNDMLNSLEGFDSGSNYKFGDKMEKPNVKRSLFDLSHLSTMTIDNAGQLIPVTMWRTLPNDDFDINVDALLRVMPQVVPLYSRQRLYLYGFYSRLIDLWNNAQVFLSKGYTGNVQKRIPYLKSISNASKKNVDWNQGESTVGPNTLFDYLGLPIGASLSSLFSESDGVNNAGISALPFMMYLRIYRDYFMNKNEWINDRVILPDDDSRFRLNDDGNLLSAVDESKNFRFKGLDKDLAISQDGTTYSCGLLFHDYPDDKFTSALPFTQRGNTPTLRSQGTRLTGTAGLDFNSAFSTANDDSLIALGIKDSESSTLNAGTIQYQSSTGYSILKTSAAARSAVKAGFNKGKAVFNNTPVSVELGITLNDIRELAIKQIELEKMARTDGSYKQFGLTFFGETSRAAYDFRPTYIGGSYKNIVFTEVLQNAATTTFVDSGETKNGTPLGSYAGHGITGINNGRIGHIHCDDYGLIMIIACIMPDIYYHQGLDKILTDSLETDMYKPERAKLGLVPILNKELYYAGNNGNSEGEDNYLWAYQNPFDDYRYMENKIHGKIADYSSKTFFPYTQARHFDSLVNWGRNFSEAKDVRKDYLYAGTAENAYSAQFSINIRAVRPIPYKAEPANIIN